MEDKVLLIALKLFLIWLFVMAFCLCICNCLFIRSDRRKTKDSKYAGAVSLIKKSPSGNILSPSSKQGLDCSNNAGDEERLIGIPLNSSSTDSQHQMAIQKQQQTIQQSQMQQGQILSSAMLSQPGFGASTQYAKPRLRQFVAVGHNHRTADLLSQLLSPPTGTYLVMGRQERFPRIETASNPTLNVEEIPRPTRVLHRQSKKPYCNHWKEYLDTSSSSSNSNNSSPRNSSSESSITLPLTPSFVITEVENFERPRSSSFSGNGSSRQGSPYRKRISPSPSPIPSDLHDGGNEDAANLTMIPGTISANERSSPSPTFLSVQSHVRSNVPLSINVDDDNGIDQQLPSVLPSPTLQTDLVLKLPSRNASPSINRRSIVSDV